MRTGLLWFIALILTGGGLAGLGTAVSSGCYYQPCSCPDAGVTDGDGDVDGDGDGDGDCVGPPEETAPVAHIDGYAAPANYVTLEPGGSVDLAGALDPEWEAPMECLLPITYQWDLGNGSTSDEQSPGEVRYSTPGYYTISMTAANSQGTEDLVPDELYISIWDGTTFVDDFEGINPFDHDISGWARRISDMIFEENPYFPVSPQWTVVEYEGGHRLYSGDWGQGFDYCQPGSQGMLSRLEATDARLTVLQYRNDPPVDQPHFTDIILRYRFNGLGEANANSQFYRARIAEVTLDTGEYCLCLDAFKINGEDEGGTGLEGSTLTGCQNQVCDYPNDFFYVTVEITGSGASVDIAMEITETTSSPTPFNAHTFVDASSPLIEPGRFGISQCVGESYFDNFRFENLD